MDFKKVLGLLIENQVGTAFFKKITPYLIQSYKQLLTNRKKLKSGLITFKEKNIYYNSICILTWFEVEHPGLTSEESNKGRFDRTQKMLEFAWNFQSLLLLIILLLLIYLFVKNQLFYFYLDLILDQSLAVPKVKGFNYILDQLNPKGVDLGWLSYIRWVNDNLFISIV